MVCLNGIHLVHKSGADPGINYEGQGVHKCRNIITKGQGGAQEYIVQHVHNVSLMV